MKHLKKLFAKFTLAALLLTAVLNAGAGTIDPAAAKYNSVVFVKSEGDALIFRTDLMKLPAGKNTLFIKDEAGNVLFTEEITTLTHQKLYRINRDNMNGIYFEVRSKKFTFRESFNFQTKVEETFTVTKVS